MIVLAYLDPGDDKGLSSLAITGIAIGAVVVVVLVVLALRFFWRSEKAARHRP